jgi:cytochrome bd-type quinol oxidase subunit 2
MKITKTLKVFYVTALLPGYVFAANIITDPTGGPVKEKEALSALITRLTQIVTEVAGIIAVAMIIWGGVLYMTSGGNEERKEKGKKTLTWAIIGLITTICAYAIVYLFTKVLGGDVS